MTENLFWTNGLVNQEEKEEGLKQKGVTIWLTCLFASGKSTIARTLKGKMKCTLCKGNMLAGKTNLPYELDREKIIVVRNVPALVCDQCGDVFVEIDILRKVEEVINRAEQNGITMAFVEYEKSNLTNSVFIYLKLLLDNTDNYIYKYLNNKLIQRRKSFAGFNRYPRRIDPCYKTSA